MAERTRIALVITELHVGGAERCLTNLATGLNRDRYEPVVYSLAPRPTQPQQLALVEQLEEAEVPVHFIGAQSARQFFSAVRSLRRKLLEQQPHIVQSFLFHANVIAGIAVRKLPETRFLTGIRVADPSRWRSRLERWVNRRAQKIVCVSMSVADFCIKRKWPADKLVVIPNGIDIGSTNRRQYEVDGLPETKYSDNTDEEARTNKTLLFVGRLHKQKGLDWLLKIAPRIFEALPEYKLQLVGDGEQRGELERLTEQYGVADRVHFEGWQPNVSDYMANADLLILPSRWEGMPNVLLEAMAIGLPLASTRTDGVRELLGVRFNQQTVAFGDDDAFVELIVQTVQDRQKTRELIQANQQRIKEAFSLEAMVRGYKRLYESVVRE